MLMNVLFGNEDPSNDQNLSEQNPKVSSSPMVDKSSETLEREQTTPNVRNFF